MFVCLVLGFSPAYTGEESRCYAALNFLYPLSKTSALHQFALCRGLGVEVYVGPGNHQTQPLPRQLGSSLVSYLLFPWACVLYAI